MIQSLKQIEREAAKSLEAFNTSQDFKRPQQLHPKHLYWEGYGNR